MSSILKIENICKFYGTLKAVNGVSFFIDKGDILGFLGPNGAGKTTTMRMLTGFLKPSRGKILYKNKDIFENLLGYRKLVGYVPEGSPLYNEMNTIDFLYFISEIRLSKTEDKNQAIEKVVKLLNLSKVLYQKIDTLSKGYKRRVGLAQSILHDPEILILDEPTDGLDPNQKNDVRRLIKQLGKEKAIIISTHILEEVDALCNRTMIISDGKLLVDDKSNNILKKSTSYNSIKISIEELTPSDLKKELTSQNLSNNILTERDVCVIKSKNLKNTKIELDKILKKKNFTINHYSLEKGDLEEVFRSLTTHA